MKSFAFIFLVTSIPGCISTKKITSFIPNDYQFSENQIGNGKTFVYQKIGTNEHTYRDLVKKNEAGKTYVINRQYALDKTFDSSKRLADKLIETYIFIFDNGRQIKGDIKEDTTIRNKTKFGLRLQRITYNASDFIVTRISKQEFLKDTSIIWEGKQLDCIAINATYVAEFQSNVNMFLKQESLSSGILYFARGLGLIRYTISFKEENYIWELKAVKDIKD